MPEDPLRAPEAPTGAPSVEPRAADERIARNRTAARWATAALWLCAAWTVFGAYVDVTGLRWAERAGRGDDSLADLSSDLDLAAGISGLVAALAAIVLFAIWFHRIQTTRRLVEPGGPDPVWATASFFVPPANFVEPYRAMRASWRAGHPAGRPGLLLGAWWGAWVVSVALAIAALVVQPVEFDLERWRAAYLLELVAMPLAFAAAVLGVVVVRRVTERLEHRLRHAGPRVSAEPPDPDRFVALDERRRPAVAVLGVTVAVNVARIVVDVLGLTATGRALDGGRAAGDAVRRAETLADVMGGLWIASVVAATVLFLLWFHRAMRNLRALSAWPPRYSPGWAVGAWFVPIVNLIVPKKAANDAWRAGDAHADVPAKVHLWWAAWIVASIASNISSRALWSPRKGLAEERDLYAIDLFAAGLEIVAALLAIAVVGDITRRQRERAAAEPAPVPAA